MSTGTADGVTIDGPYSSGDDLGELSSLWGELQRHHLEVSAYRRLVSDPEVSWARRRAWYEEILSDGGCYWVARNAGREPVAYALVEVTEGPDDSFEQTGVVELISLVVASGARSGGIGRRLVAAAATWATERGIDTLKVEFMIGNDRAGAFYHSMGFEPAETVSYRRLD